MSVQNEVEGLIETIITRTHQHLSTNFTLISETRDLNPRENQLLLQLDSNQVKYRQLAGALAIQTYSQYVIQLLSGCEPLLEVTALIFSNLSQARSWALQTGASELSEMLEECWVNLSSFAQITHKLFPRSPMVSVHRSFIEQAGLDPSQTIYTRLYEQNQDLKSKLQQNDKQVLELELKLTKLLQQHDGCESNVDSSLRMLELREQLAFKNEEIERMNEEFAAQIQKYNTVYEAMKREIEDLKDYKEVDLVEMVQKLETEIVKLREEKQRDQILIRELRERGTGSYVSSGRRTNTYSRLYY